MFDPTLEKHQQQQQQKSRFRRIVESRLLIRPPIDEDPRLFSTGTKGIILVALALCASSAGFSSTIYFPGMYIYDNLISLHRF